MTDRYEDCKKISDGRTSARMYRSVMQEKRIRLPPFIDAGNGGGNQEGQAGPGPEEAGAAPDVDQHGSGASRKGNGPPSSGSESGNEVAEDNDSSSTFDFPGSGEEDNADGLGDKRARSHDERNRSTNNNSPPSSGEGACSGGSKHNEVAAAAIDDDSGYSTDEQDKDSRRPGSRRLSSRRGGWVSIPSTTGRHRWAPRGRRRSWWSR